MNNVFDINIGRVFYLPAVDFDIATGINFGVVSVDGVVGLSNSHAIAIKLSAQFNRSQAVDSGAILVFYGFCTNIYARCTCNRTAIAGIGQILCTNRYTRTINAATIFILDIA